MDQAEKTLWVSVFATEYEALSHQHSDRVKTRELATRLADEALKNMRERVGAGYRNPLGVCDNTHHDPGLHPKHHDCTKWTFVEMSQAFRR